MRQRPILGTYRFLGERSSLLGHGLQSFVAGHKAGTIWLRATGISSAAFPEKVFARSFSPQQLLLRRNVAGERIPLDGFFLEGLFQKISAGERSPQQFLSGRPLPKLFCRGDLLSSFPLEHLPTNNRHG